MARPPPDTLPDLDPILDRLRAQVTGTEPGGGRLSRTDVLVLAILATEREAVRAWTVHRAGCSFADPAGWKRRCTCGLEAAEARSLSLRRLLPRAVPEVPEEDPARRGKRGPVR